MPLRVNKRELALILNCSVLTLDAHIARHGADVPVVERGTNGRAWAFDPDATRAFLKTKRKEREDEQRRAAAKRQAMLLQYTLALGEAENQPSAGLSASEQLAFARLRRIEREEAVASGRLVDVETLRAPLEETFRTLRALQVRHIIDATRANDLSDEARQAMIEALERSQREAVAQMQGKLRLGLGRPPGLRLAVDNDAAPASDRLALG
jgi:phage terminase Nu1 subunit (DNA packaging protein)